MKTPFKMKSGNSPAFKTMGGSPLQKGPGGTGSKAEYMFKVKPGTASNIPNTSTLPDGTVTDFDASKRQVINPSKKITKPKTKSILSKVKSKVSKVIKHPVTKKILKFGGLAALGSLKYDPNSGMSKKEYALSLLKIKGPHKGKKN